jgi:putative oxidoreductase
MKLQLSPSVNTGGLINSVASESLHRPSITQRPERVSRIVIPIRPDIATLPRPGLRWSEATQRKVLFLLRLSLAAVFFWFGILKVANVSPVDGLLRASFPFLANSPYIEILGVAEMIIAVGLVIDTFATHATVLMILHLLGTLSVALIAPNVVFAPVFPVLTMDGEFLVKNFVLIMAGLVIMFSRGPITRWGAATRG